MWHMRIASWMTKATNTHSEYVILFFFLLFYSNNGSRNAPQCYVISTLFIIIVPCLTENNLSIKIRAILMKGLLKFGSLKEVTFGVLYQ